MNIIELGINGYKWNAREFIDAWKDTEKSSVHKYVPISAQTMCNNWIRQYAQEAQNKMNLASEVDDSKARRLYQYIRASAFAIIRKEEVHAKDQYEEQTKRYMAECISNTLEIFTVQWDQVRKEIAAGSPYKKELRKILPNFADAFDSLSDAADKLNKSLKAIWLKTGEFKELPTIKV